MPLHGQGLVRTPPFWFLVLCPARNPALPVALPVLLSVVLATAGPYTAYTTQTCALPCTLLARYDHRPAHIHIPGLSLVLLSRAHPPVHPLYPTHPSLQSLPPSLPPSIHPSIHPSILPRPPLASATPHIASPQQRAPSAYMTLRPTSGLVAPLTLLKRRGDPAAVLLASLTSA
ncbi:hypothetical protein M441DRAFT_277421 [Trichoderma asperellum CBS 433.97]|uniref:Uncharacterized protein n=1 Tax=Trichoderma asperellum (strain ATCC 204424 / CBS 433.97 / NBRC 101777) TaxID=1042311 RepID=A0A2T3YUX7_TRIA4|nr:hypothetical protein M441DRAFT_277421 [Trichoderma asperellum CBS 433.97]PTB36373.1 hypothetical protein M441DRAFT_277421 [Trichoderma asperellum CBS 433.97]WVH32623.1 hypothetical protein [Trichoderma asperellum]